MSQPTLSDSALKELIASSDANTKNDHENQPLENIEELFLEITEDIDNSEAVCENKAEERVALILPTEQITHAADQLIENATADNMYSVYKIMDCDDEYTTGSQKVFLAAATATTISTVMVATKALLGSYHTFNGLTDRVNELEAKLAATEEDLEECEVTLEVQEVEIEEQEAEIEEQEAELEEKEAEIEEQEAEIEEQEAEIEEQEAEIEGLEESLAAAAVAANAALEFIDGAAVIIETALGFDSEPECEAELEEKEAELEEKEAELEEKEAEIEEQEAELEEKEAEIEEQEAECEAEIEKQEAELEAEIEGLEESLANAAIAGNAALENVQKLEEILDHLEDVQEAMEIVDDTEAILEDALGLGDESRLEDEEITA